MSNCNPRGHPMSIPPTLFFSDSAQSYYDYYAANDLARRGIMKIRSGDDIVSTNMDQVFGVALVQTTDRRILRCGIFPSKTANEVSLFTAAAKTYEH